MLSNIWKKEGIYHFAPVAFHKRVGGASGKELISFLGSSLIQTITLAEIDAFLGGCC